MALWEDNYYIEASHNAKNSFYAALKIYYLLNKGNEKPSCCIISIILPGEISRDKCHNSSTYFISTLIFCPDILVFFFCQNAASVNL